MTTFTSGLLNSAAKYNIQLSDTSAKKALKFVEGTSAKAATALAATAEGVFSGAIALATRPFSNKTSREFTAYTREAFTTAKTAALAINTPIADRIIVKKGSLFTKKSMQVIKGKTVTEFLYENRKTIAKGIAVTATVAALYAGYSYLNSPSLEGTSPIEQPLENVTAAPLVNKAETYSKELTSIFGITIRGNWNKQ